MALLFYAVFFLISNSSSYSDIDIAIIGKWEDGVLPHLILEKALIEKEMGIQGTSKVYTLRSVEVIVNYL